MENWYRPGLDGVQVARTALSRYDGEAGTLVYRCGYHIEDLVDRPFDDVAHLLWLGSLPPRGAAHDVRRGLAAGRRLRPAALAVLHDLDPQTDPMTVLQTVLAMHATVRATTVERSAPSLDEAMVLTAVLPTIAAAHQRRRWGLEPVPPREDLGHAANFLYMLHGREPHTEALACLERYLVVMAEHGMNPSTFVACAVASTGSDLCSAVLAAIGSLKGPAHGGAVIGARRMLDELPDAVGAGPFVREKLARQERLMGFGHREYRTYDPRAKIFRELCRRYNEPYYTKAHAVELVALTELAKRYPERPNFTNVDYYAAGVLQPTRLDVDFLTCVFALARVVGWTAHVLEYLTLDGRMISPTSRWIGPDLPVAVPVA